MKIETLVLATKNKNKVKEIISLFNKLPLAGDGSHKERGRFPTSKGEPSPTIAIETLDKWKNAPDIQETGETLEDNAILKARGIAEFTGKWVFADDSGLEVDALGGAPGVKSARFSGEACSYEDNNKKLLKLLEGIPYKERKARFRCVIALVSPEKKVWIVQGTLEGYIAKESKGDNGFGYDPVFIFSDTGKHLAEMTMEEKNNISHRGKALKNLIKLIQSFQIQE